MERDYNKDYEVPEYDPYRNYCEPDYDDYSYDESMYDACDGMEDAYWNID